MHKPTTLNSRQRHLILYILIPDIVFRENDAVLKMW